MSGEFKTGCVVSFSFTLCTVPVDDESVSGECGVAAPIPNPNILLVPRLEDPSCMASLVGEGVLDWIMRLSISLLSLRRIFFKLSFSLLTFSNWCLSSFGSFVSRLMLEWI